MAGGLDPGLTKGWLPRLPAGWAADRLGNRAWIRARLGWRGLTADEYVDDGVPMLSTPDIKGDQLGFEHANRITWERYMESPEIQLMPGDVLLTKDGATIGIVNVVTDLPEPATVNGSVAVITPNVSTEPRYLRYCLASRYSQQVMSLLQGGMGVPHLFQADIKRIVLPFPGISVQRAIADFLDRETAKIDTLIGKQQRLIEGLHQRLGTMIEELVRGDLQAAWSAADLPEGWVRARNKQLFREVAELSTNGTEEPLSVSHLTGVSPRSEKNVTMIESESYIGYRVVQPGDLVINTMWAWMGALGVSAYHGVVSPAYGVYRLRSTIAANLGYLDALYRSRGYVDLITNHSRGVWSSRLRIYPDVFLRLPIILPPIAEQEAIAGRIATATARTDLLVAKAESAIELAQERRAALITAAVTGQLDLATERVV